MKQIRQYCYAAVWYWLHLPLDETRYILRGRPASGRKNEQTAPLLRMQLK